MSSRRALAVIAFIVLAVGVGLAVTPLSVGSIGDTVDCCNAAVPVYAEADIREMWDTVDGRLPGRYVARCEEAVSDRRLLAFPLAGVGAVVLLFLLLTKPADKVTDPERSAP